MARRKDAAQRAQAAQEPSEHRQTSILQGEQPQVRGMLVSSCVPFICASAEPLLGVAPKLALPCSCCHLIATFEPAL
jgi:hypothetical protein